MLKDYLEQRHSTLASGRSAIALEREYWKALETLAYDDGWHNWRDFFHAYVLVDKQSNGARTISSVPCFFGFSLLNPCTH